MIVLIGPMGAGKTTVGTHLARVLECPFIDTDEVVAQRLGRTIPEIFAAVGEVGFREAEQDAVLSVLSGPEGAATDLSGFSRAHQAGPVVALGGGAPTIAQVRTALRPHLTIYLRLPSEAAEDRLGSERTGASRLTRPLLAGADTKTAMTRWCRIAEEREPIYRELADVTLDASRSVEDLVQQILHDFHLPSETSVRPSITPMIGKESL
ncbi:shikimate kinase [Devriesea agamarum]|uniref:shikimate kinase n=1 Tax=Devriesea agamarum TaxID=472569 RepID=UPI00071DB3DB|nr:shikimate kinase [Devriesea agamarum]